MTEQLIYVNPHWQKTLHDCGLDSFESLWQLDLKAVDEGNVGRGKNGWSKVSIFEFQDQQQHTHKVVIKRQSNYRSRTLRHLISGIPTFIKEMDSIARYEKAGVPALNAVYCATRQQGGDLQAILVTEFLSDYESLEAILQRWQQQGRPQRTHCQKVIQATGKLVARLHGQGLEHRCLFPKHIFIAQTDDASARLIDLEKTRWRPWLETRRVRDLTALARRSLTLPNRDRVAFLRAYYAIPHLDERAKNLWRQVAKRINAKKRS
jgi:tRNA A-37 threonylcarbamoyl transferase component Bud32